MRLGILFATSYNYPRSIMSLFCMELKRWLSGFLTHLCDMMESDGMKAGFPVLRSSILSFLIPFFFFTFLKYRHQQIICCLVTGKGKIEQRMVLEPFYFWYWICLFLSHRRSEYLDNCRLRLEISMALRLPCVSGWYNADMFVKNIFF